ncbi:replication initiator protein A [Clostridium perfringens]
MNNEIKYSFCEKNLMILPFISLKREPEKIIQREWKMINGEIANIKVVGGQYGVPQIFELDVLLALFNIAFKNSNNSFANIFNTITFTYQELSEEIGYSQYSGKVKFLLKRSIEKINETTIYNNKNSFFNAKLNKYTHGFGDGISCRIFKNYCSYKEKGCQKQIVVIDDSFMDNIKNNYYSSYDYEKYKNLKSSIAKRLYLMITALGMDQSKFLTYKTLADYLILDYSEPTKKRYTTHLINKAIEELVEANIIKSFERDRGKGVNIYFKDLISDYIWGELSKLQISWEELIWLTQNTSKEYLVGVLKYINYKQTVKKEKIKNIKKYFLSAFNFYNQKDFKKWNIDEFL